MENITQKNDKDTTKIACVIKDSLVLRLVISMVNGMGNTPIEWNHIIRKAKECKEALIKNGVLEYQELTDILPDTDIDDYLSHNIIHL